MRLFIFIFLFTCSFAWADESDLAYALKEAKRTNTKLTTADQSSLLTKGWRNRRPGENTPLVTALRRPSDYLDNEHRGTTEYSAAVRNYSFHKVIIPSGTVVKGSNFSQWQPETDIFDRSTPSIGHNLTFEHCNLVNVKVYPDYKIKSSNNAQMTITKTVDKDGMPQENHQWTSQYSANLGAKSL